MKSNLFLKDKDSKTIIVKENMYGLHDEFKYFITKNGSLVINKVPSNIAEYYPKDYYSFNQNTVNQNIFFKKLKKIRNKYSLERKGFLGKVLNTISPEKRLSAISDLKAFHKDAKILDVGCGDGKLVSSLYELGYLNTSGIDPFLKENKTEGYSLFKKSIYEIDGKYDIIILYHVFEHIDEPEKALKQLKEHLTTNGTIIIAIPLADSYAFEEYKENWVQVDAPRHFYIYSKKDFSQLCNQCDLEIYKTIYNSDEFQFWGSEQYQSGISLFDEKSYLKGIENSIFDPKKIKSFKKKAIQLNKEQKGDQAVFFIKNK